MEYLVAIYFLFVSLSVDMDKPETTISLAPNKKESNAIVLKADNKSFDIDKPMAYVDLSSNDKKPSKGIYTKTQFEKKFKDLLAIKVKKPSSLYIYFDTGDDKLTNKNNESLKQVIKELQKRKTRDITIIGHTDTVGTYQDNLQLSKKRVSRVKKWLLSQKFQLNTLTTEHYGENDLLVQTADNVNEPQNRRVEIFIR